jgi:hypothetical protein
MRFAAVKLYPEVRTTGRCRQLRRAAQTDTFFLCAGMATSSGYCMRCLMEREDRGL